MNCWCESKIVGADAQYYQILSVQIVLAVAEAAGLLGAARRVVLGIEIQHHFLTLKLVQRDGSATGRGKGKGRSLVAGLKLYAHGYLLLSRMGCLECPDYGYPAQWAGT